MYWRVASIWILYSCPWQDLLSENGRFYLVALKQNNISGIQQRMLEEHGLESQVCDQYVLISGAETPYSRSYYNGKQAENISSYCVSRSECHSYSRQQEKKIVDEIECSRNKSWGLKRNI